MDTLDKYSEEDKKMADKFMYILDEFADDVVNNAITKMTLLNGIKTRTYFTNLIIKKLVENLVEDL